MIRNGGKIALFQVKYFFTVEKTVNTGLVDIFLTEVEEVKY